MPYSHHHYHSSYSSAYPSNVITNQPRRYEMQRRVQTGYYPPKNYRQEERGRDRYAEDRDRDRRPRLSPGLDELSRVESVFISQKVDWMDLVVDWESNHGYSIRTVNGQQLFMALEDTDCCSKMCCGNKRGYTIKLVNMANQEVAVFRRPFKCCANDGACLCACCSCCSNETTIEAPEGNVIGEIRQRATCCVAGYSVYDAHNRHKYDIDGAGCCKFFCCCWCRDEVYPIKDPETGAQVGELSKKWSGFAKEVFTEADNFGITFPRSCTLNTKLTMIGACFLVDFMNYSEKNEHNEVDFY